MSRKRLKKAKKLNELPERAWLDEVIKEIEGNAPDKIPKDSVLIFLYGRKVYLQGRGGELKW